MTMMNKLEESKDRTLTISKTFNSPINLVWEAWTKAQHIAKWYVPEGMDIKIIEHDFRVGGKWHYTMIMPDGNEFDSSGEYLEIIENEKIVTSADFKPMTIGVEMHIVLKDNDGKTDFSFHVIHSSPEYSKQQEQMGFYNGWGSVFERLEKLLENL
jgi:uncharacterized protein YndB with AHSA1/START domain